MGPGFKTKGWEAKGTAYRYFLFDLDRPPEKGQSDDPKAIPNAMMAYLGLGGISEATTTVQVDGLPGQQYEPVKGFGFSGIYVYRSVEVRDHVYVFGVFAAADDPAAKKFFDSVKFARAADGSPAGPSPPSPVGMPGLVAYLSFDDDPADGSALDQVTKAPAGKPVGKVSRAPGVRGKALDLSDGTGSLVLADLPATTVAAGKSYSVSVWFKAAQANGTVFFAGSKPAKPNAPYPHLELGLNPKYNLRDEKEDRNAAFARFLPPGDHSRETVIPYPDRLTGTWVHMAFTRDGGDGQGTLYVDAFRVLGRGQGMVGAIGGPEVFLGGLSPVPRTRRNPAAPEVVERKPFAGLIDEFALFDAALSEDDVRKLAGK
jgi:hypothetical protein